MNRRVLGLGLAAIGGGLIFYGLKAADALGSRVTELWTGRPSDESLAFLVGGAALAVVGLGLALKGAGPQKG